MGKMPFLSTPTLKSTHTDWKNHPLALILFSFTTRFFGEKVLVLYPLQLFDIEYLHYARPVKMMA